MAAINISLRLDDWDGIASAVVVPLNILTLGGEPLTLGGSFLTLGA